jgi:hypothetical protein
LIDSRIYAIVVVAVFTLLYIIRICPDNQGRAATQSAHRSCIGEYTGSLHGQERCARRVSPRQWSRDRSWDFVVAGHVHLPLPSKRVDRPRGRSSSDPSSHPPPPPPPSAMAGPRSRRPTRTQARRVASTLSILFLAFIAILCLCPVGASAQASDNKEEYGTVIGIGKHYGSSMTGTTDAYSSIAQTWEPPTLASAFTAAAASRSSPTTRATVSHHHGSRSAKRSAWSVTPPRTHSTRTRRTPSSTRSGSSAARWTTRT